MPKSGLNFILIMSLFLFRSAPLFSDDTTKVKLFFDKPFQSIHPELARHQEENFQPWRPAFSEDNTEEAKKGFDPAELNSFNEALKSFEDKINLDKKERTAADGFAFSLWAFVSAAKNGYMQGSKKMVGALLECLLAYAHFRSKNIKDDLALQKALATEINELFLLVGQRVTIDTQAEANRISSAVNLFRRVSGDDKYMMKLAKGLSLRAAEDYHNLYFFKSLGGVLTGLPVAITTYVMSLVTVEHWLGGGILSNTIPITITVPVFILVQKFTSDHLPPYSHFTIRSKLKVETVSQVLNRHCPRLLEALGVVRGESP